MITGGEWERRKILLLSKIAQNFPNVEIELIILYFLITATIRFVEEKRRDTWSLLRSEW